MLRLCVTKTDPVGFLWQGFKEIGKFLRAPKSVKQCHMCYKYCVRIRPDRHSDCFASQGANYYRYAKFDENYCCMVCL